MVAGIFPARRGCTVNVVKVQSLQRATVTRASAYRNQSARCCSAGQVSLALGYAFRISSSRRLCVGATPDEVPSAVRPPVADSAQEDQQQWHANHLPGKTPSSRRHEITWFGG